MMTSLKQSAISQGLKTHYYILREARTSPEWKGEATKKSKRLG